jgi:hypothetical protein
MTPMRLTTARSIRTTRRGCTTPRPPSVRVRTDLTSDVLYGAESESYVERNLATGQERQLFRTADASLRLSGLSPDGRFVVGFTVLPESTLVVIDTTSGLTRELLHIRKGGVFSRHGGLRWTPDWRALVAIESTNGTSELWFIPLEGQPRRLSIGVTNLNESDIDIHPDGHQIAFAAGGPPSTDIRILEHFLPDRQRPQ